MDIGTKTLIIACVALALVVVVLVIAIVGIYYALNPSKNLGNISTGSITSSGPITTTDSVAATSLTVGPITSGAITSGAITSGSITSSGQIKTSGSIISSGTITTDGSITSASTLNSNGINLANPSGAVALLNFNTGPVAYSSPLTGAFSSVFNWTATFLRVGNLVTMQWGACVQTLTVSSILSPTIGIPSEFIPSATIQFPVIVSNAGSGTNGLMIVFGSSGGDISICATAAQGPFTSGTVGILPGVASWSFA